MIFLFRHGESAANAGLRTTDTTTVPLTQRGEEQALLLREKIKNLDYTGRVFSSDFKRAKQTAELAWGQPFEIADIQELTLFDPVRFSAGSTREERRGSVLEWWARGDPDWRDSEFADSYNSFVERVDAFLRHESALAFTHETFMKMAMCRGMGLSLSMGDFYRWCCSFEIPNCGCLAVKSGEILTDFAWPSVRTQESNVE